MIVFGCYYIEKKTPVDVDERLLEKLAEVATSGFGRKMDYEDVKNHVMEADSVFVAYAEEYIVRSWADLKHIAPVGFCSYKIHGNVGKLVGAAVKSEFQDKGIFKELNRRCIREFISNDVDYIVADTQNPLVYREIAKYCKKIFPNSEGPIGKDVLNVAGKLYTGFDDNLILRKFYGRRLADRYVTPDAELGKLFSRLNIEDGDAFVIVGLLGKRKAKESLERKAKMDLHRGRLK